MNPQLTRLRAALGFETQAAIAKALGIKQGTWSKYENGKLHMPVPTAQKLIALAKGRRLLIDLNHVFEDIPLPPAQAAQARG